MNIRYHAKRTFHSLLDAEARIHRLQTPGSDARSRGNDSRHHHGPPPKGDPGFLQRSRRQPESFSLLHSVHPGTNSRLEERRHRRQDSLGSEKVTDQKLLVESGMKACFCSW